MKDYLIFWSPRAEETYLKILSQILYLYTATGSKHKKTVETGSSNTIRNYAGNIEFDSHQLDFIGTSEGRITESGENYSYEYFLKDHLGIVRVIFSDDGAYIHDYKNSSEFAALPLFTSVQKLAVCVQC